MSRRLCFALPLALGLLVPATGAAAEDCPDGWFCEPGAPPKQDAPTPAPAGDRPRPLDPAPLGAPPGTRPPSEPIYLEPRDAMDAPEEGAPNEKKKKKKRRHFREWGFNLHLQAALIGDRHDRADNSGMAGLGFAVRYRIMPALAFEAGVDLLTGTDFQGYSRGEAALLANTLVFFNPRDPVQFYALGGLGFAAARVTIAPRAGENGFERHDENYSYFGGQLGLGVEVRATRRIAFSGDLIGFVRGRIDDKARYAPEFIDASTHRATNTSGGGLLRVGATFYW
jgi:hypothetical protein